MFIECFKVSVTHGGITTNYKWRITNIFFINFSGLQQEVFPIFKLLNSTEVAYDN